MPVVAVGLITGIEQVEAIVGTGDADMIALARTILYDPHWPWHAAAELGAQVRARKQYLRVPSRDSTRICSRIGRRLGHRTDCRVRPRARVARMRRNPRLQRRPSSSPTHSSESTLSGESSTGSASAHPFLNPAEHLRESSPRTTFRIKNVLMFENAATCLYVKSERVRKYVICNSRTRTWLASFELPREVRAPEATSARAVRKNGNQISGAPVQLGVELP
jgi:hypothetical protein